MWRKPGLDGNRKKCWWCSAPNTPAGTANRWKAHWREARFLKPDILLFCAFQFDEEAAKDIDEAPEHLIGFTLLKAQMNADLLTDDLRKKRSSNESFWLVGQPDVKIHNLKDGMVKIEVMGFDYYNPKTGNVESGGKKNIAMWMLDTDYDGRVHFSQTGIFPHGRGKGRMGQTRQKPEGGN